MRWATLGNSTRHCSATAGACAFAATIDIGGPSVPQVAGIMNMTGNFAAAACPILVARLFQLTENWNLILLLFAGVFLAGAICWLLVNPQQRVRTVDESSSHSCNFARNI